VLTLDAWRSATARPCCGGKDIFLNGLDMLLHRLARQFRVMSLDGHENRSMGRQRFMGTTWGL